MQCIRVSKMPSEIKPIPCTQALIVGSLNAPLKFPSSEYFCMR